MASLTLLPTAPLRFARAVAKGVADRVRTAVAERTAAPVVVAVRKQGLTRLSVWALADLHDRVVEAEADGTPGVIAVVGDEWGGAAVVLADARSSAREVRVYGAADPDRVAAALTAHGFRPEATRVTFADGPPEAGGEDVAVAYVATAEPEALRATLNTILDRLAVGGVAVVDAYDEADGRAVVDAACAGRPVRLVQRARVNVVREG